MRSVHKLNDQLELSLGWVNLFVMSLEQMDHVQEDSKPRWRRLIPQFRLRTILILTALPSLILGLWGCRTSQQITVLKWIESNGGSAGYDYHWHG